MQIHGRVFYVTGAASGLGEAAARSLHARGARVLLLDRNSEGAAAVAESLGLQRARAAADTDILNTDQIKAAIALGDEVWPDAQPGGVVHAAGVAVAEKTLDNEGNPHELDLFQKVVEINLVGTFNVARLVAARLVRDVPKPAAKATAESRGVIILVSSAAGLEGQIGQAAYGSSKAGVVGLALPMARDLAWWGIRTLAVCPAMFSTQMGNAINERGTRATPAFTYCITRLTRSVR